MLPYIWRRAEMTRASEAPAATDLSQPAPAQPRSAATVLAEIQARRGVPPPRTREEVRSIIQGKSAAEVLAELRARRGALALPAGPMMGAETLAVEPHAYGMTAVEPFGGGSFELQGGETAAEPTPDEKEQRDRSTFLLIAAGVVIAFFTLFKKG